MALLLHFSSNDTRKKCQHESFFFFFNIYFKIEIFLLFSFLFFLFFFPPFTFRILFHFLYNWNANIKYKSMKITEWILKSSKETEKKWTLTILETGHFVFTGKFLSTFQMLWPISVQQIARRKKRRKDKNTTFSVFSSVLC